MKFLKIFIIKAALLVILLNEKIIYAQQDTGLPAGYMEFMGGFVIFLVFILLLLILLYGRDKYETGRIESSVGNLLSRLKYAVSGAVPLEKEKDITMEHAYDGIRELDNKVPPWFNILFYGTVVFAVIYLLVYHVFNISPLQQEEYNAEMQAAQEQRDMLMKTGSLINEDNVTLLTDEASLNEGKLSYGVNCSPCHAQDGGGSVGPNLTDEFWVHGGGIKNVFKTIKYGVPAKGMIPWQNALSPKKIQEISSYVLSLQGTTPLNPKPPEGQPYRENDTVKANDTTNTDLKKQ